MPMAPLCFVIIGKCHVKGWHKGDESICTLLGARSWRLREWEVCFVGLVDDGFGQSSRNEPEVSMSKRNDQFERDIQQDVSEGIRYVPENQQMRRVLHHHA